MKDTKIFAIVKIKMQFYDSHKRGIFILLIDKEMT